MSDLVTLAAEAGLQHRWTDADGHAHEVSGETLCLLLEALGLATGSEAQISDSREKLRVLRRQGAERFCTAWQDQPTELPFSLTGTARLHLESGGSMELELAEGTLAGIAEPGYHRLEHRHGETTIAVAPHTCFGLGDCAPGRRIWGAAAQLPSLRGSRAMPFGDFSTLREAVTRFARQGADVLAISPVHAMFPSDPGRFSPYGPSSRSFLNVLFCDPALAGGQYRAVSEDTSLVGWHEANPRRLQELRRIFDALEPGPRQPIDDAHGGQRHLHAVFDALDAHFRARQCYGWQSWPAAYHDPGSEAVAAFARDQAEEVAFYEWLQGLAARSLGAAQNAARQAGMGCGVVTDLAVGIDPGGSDSWKRPEAFLRGVSVGAPPDPLGPDGQDWGLTTFNPLTLPFDEFRAFRETLAAAMQYAGGVRIDHFLGMHRIWLVPRGQPSTKGCYMAFPQADLFRILALESRRHRALVIGEDLGTVPAGLRAQMAEAGILGMRVLWFERDGKGDYILPREWDRQAAAMTSTHDLPTLAGWWVGRDIDWTWRIGRKSRFASEAEERENRQRERERIWSALIAAGHAHGPCPAADEPLDFVTAACRHVAASDCDLALFPLEDLFGLVEQPNLPGTIDQHPNWRRRMPEKIESLLADPSVVQRVAAIAEARQEGRRR